MSCPGHKLIGFACGLALYVLGVQPVEAAFLTVSFDEGFAELATSEPVTGAAALSEETPAEEHRTFNPFLVDPGLLALPPDSSGGMGSNGSSGPSSVPSVVLADSDESSAGQIVSYLADQPGLLIPVPFLDGAFRPPKCVA